MPLFWAGKAGVTLRCGHLSSRDFYLALSHLRGNAA
jgi:hypothetical protein